MSGLIKINGKRVGDVLAHAGIDADGVALLRPDALVEQGIEVLRGAERIIDALRLLAHALPKRESVWWACTCCRALLGMGIPLTDEPAIARAEAWVYEPRDKNARAAYSEAEERGFQTPGGWAAVAAFWSSGSLAPAEQPAVPPADYLTGVAVAGAVTLAAVVEPVVEMESRYARFLKFGLDIAAGGTARGPDGKPV